MARHFLFFVTIATLVVTSAPPARQAAYIEVYRAGEAGYHTFRIPSVIATHAGTLLAFAEGRRAGAGDAGDIDLVVKRSPDGGRTWSGLQVVGDSGPNTFGNPCAVVDRDTGTVWLLTTQNLGTDQEKDIIAGTSKAGRTVWVLKSTDDGATWSTPEDITRRVKEPDWTWYATGPGVGIQTRAGRLVVPANHAVAGSGVHRSHVIYSDDGGRTWGRGGAVEGGTNESQVVELADGSLMINMRNHPAKPENFRMVATSGDGGRPLLFSNPASTRRERMTVRVSYDEGATWPVSRVVHDGPAAYSSLVVLPDGTIGLLFERGATSPYETITFARFTLEWLTGGRDR
jgi:sialidase-1